MPVVASVAMMVVSPAATGITTPRSSCVLPTIATSVLEELQTTWLVTSLDVPLLKCAVAVNARGCDVRVSATTGGETSIDVMTAATTVNEASAVASLSESYALMTTVPVCVPAVTTP